MTVTANRSVVLKYFTEIGDHKVKCQICQAKLSYQSTTSTTRQHMLLKHNGEFGKADPAAAPRQDAADSRPCIEDHNAEYFF